ncbi:MAG: universal stress protein [Oscillatoriales cyanobacterium RM2_1_1]|nr:universal stress protein [Oscillatoriales cyanobacterium SM2_3_0]NJO44632.1 universal stress protein [Oscillatoriales cyanobacterium RM2_1_1]
MQLLSWLPDSPIVTFTILLLVSLTLPPWFERLKLPGLVGLLLAGVALGEHGLGVLNSQSETMKLLSDIGKIYLMFVAGLEIDLAQFNRKKNRALGFGIATFVFPMIAGMITGLYFGFGWNAAILVGSLLASHTLLAYPIIQRLGLAEIEPVVISIGGAIFTSISALLVLAICVPIHTGSFSALDLVKLLISLTLYSGIVLFGFDWAGKNYFRRTGNDEGNQFLFVLLAVFLASVGAQVIGVDQIVGAFLAGLAVNDVVGNSPVKDKVEFVGSVLFIPFFFIAMGLLINVPVFISTLINDFGLALAIVLGLILSKWIAAWVTKLFCGYNWDETLLIWSLSLPQVATTLAATLVGFQVGLLTESVFNSVIVLMLATSILGPLLTQRFALPLLLRQTRQVSDSVSIWWENQQEHHEDPIPFAVVVPVSNPDTERYLIQMAALIAHHESGSIIPLSIATHAQIHMDEPELQLALKQSRALLKQALQVGEEFQVETKPVLRIDGDVATGIIRTACEQDASLIVMGWSEITSFQALLFGTVINNVFWSCHCPVAVMRLLQEPVKIQRILVLVKTLKPPTLRTVRFAQLVASTNQATVTLLYVCPEQTSDTQVARIQESWVEALEDTAVSSPVSINVIAADHIATTILGQAQQADLVVMRSHRRRTAGGLIVSSLTHELVTNLNCSLVLFAEPQS